MTQNCSWGNACRCTCPSGENPVVGPPLTAMDAAWIGSPFPSQAAMDTAAWECSPPLVVLEVPGWVQVLS